MCKSSMDGVLSSAPASCVPTGFAALDALIGLGGIPLSTGMLFNGPLGVGHFKVVTNAQRTNPQQP